MPFLFHPLSLLLLCCLIPGTIAVSCGNTFTSDCLGDTDVRYDADYPKDIVLQDPRWEKFQGLFQSNILAFDGDGNLRQTEPFNTEGPDGLPPYDTSNRTAFYNHTIVGSRLLVQRVYLYGPASSEFCQRNVTPPFLNVISPGVCGENGYSEPAGFYGTTTYENNGDVSVFRITGTYSPFGFLAPLDVPNSTIYQNINDQSLWGATEIPDVGSQNNAFVFIDNDTVEVHQTYVNLITRRRENFVVATMSRLGEEEWKDSLLQAYETFNVPEEQRVVVPVVDPFFPSEEEWCGGVGDDPSCTDSPFKEPEATVDAGAIAGFTVLGFCIVIGLLYLWHRRILAKRDERNRVKFARRIAETVELRGSTRQLSPEGLVKEFDAINNKHKDGYITKDELWEFVSSGQGGEMDERDFNALFAAIDLDDSGKVDFMEFCAFMGKCYDDFESVKKRKSVVAARLSVRNVAAERLSMVGSDADNTGRIEAVGEEEVEEKDEEGKV